MVYLLFGRIACAADHAAPPPTAGYNGGKGIIACGDQVGHVKGIIIAAGEIRAGFAGHRDFGNDLGRYISITAPVTSCQKKSKY